MESQPQNPEFRINPENFHPCGCFIFIVFWMSCLRYHSLPFPNDAVGWSVVCDCGISRSFSLTFSLSFP